MRAVRIARSVGRPSRLKKPPGIFPAAYIRSSTSTVSGKKSAPSRGSIRPCAVASTIVSPDRTTTAPSACFASLPVSKLISRPPIVTLTSARRSVAIAICLFLHSASREWGLESASRPALARISTLSFLPSRARLEPGSGVRFRLPPQPQFLDQCPVPLQVVLLEIVQETAAPANQLEQPASRVMVFRMRPQVLRQLVDPLREQRDLHLGRARVCLVRPMLLNDLVFGFLREAHASPFVSSVPAIRRKQAESRGCVPDRVAT